jgi:hypothetical protein
MVDNDDKYADDEEGLTQVRSIIKQLNEEKPSQEREREVVTRADGTKMVRVTKKRRVMLTSADKRRRSRRHLFAFVALLMIALAALVAFLFFRMSSMSSSAYMSAGQAELQKTWGASLVQIQGEGVNGMSLQLDSLVADFPEDCMIQRVELTGVKAELDIMTFISGILKSEEMSVDRVLLVLRPGAAMNMPKQQGKNLWDFRRVECKDFNVQYGADNQGPVAIKRAETYMYYPDASRRVSVLMFREGVLEIKNWKDVRIRDGKAHLSASGLDDFYFHGTTDVETETVEQRRTSIAFAGAMKEGATLAEPVAMESDNMSLADFTDGRFEEFFTARTVRVSRGKPGTKATITLSADGAAPEFKGEFHLKDICLSSFPALMAITEHIEPQKRRLYNPISFHRGRAVVAHEEGSYSLEIPHGGLLERDLASISGRMVVNGANELTGELAYNIPQVLARVEYPDGQPDPIFQANGEWATLRTNLRGRGNMPGDNMAEVEAIAVQARLNRPARIPFGQYDVNKLTERFLGTPAAQPAPVQAEQPASEPLQQSSKPLPPASSNPFETAEDPFAPSSAIPF